MAGAIHSTKLEKPKLPAKQKQEDPSKFYYHFLYKAVMVAIFLVILPLFPSQAPEFIDHSLLTRSWELLHLLFVGIAISYGVFSRRNHETEKENSSKFDNAHFVVSRFLQVSSFFEDEAEKPSDSDETQVQIWSTQYHSKKPTVVVAPQRSSFEEKSAASSRIGEKPLLLPVRSLKPRVSDPCVVQSANVSSSASKSVSKRFSTNANKARNEELEGCGSSTVEDNIKENVVLPSPIPWRSSLSMDHESEFNKLESRLMKSQQSRSSRPSSASSSPKLTPSSSFSSSKELSSSPSFSSSESLAKNAEDLMRKKGFYMSSPPPPPPSPPIFQKPRTSSFNKGTSFDKELKQSFTSERNGLNWWSSGHKLKGRVDSEKEVKPKGPVENFSMRKTVRVKKKPVEGINGSIEKSSLEAEKRVIEEPKRKTLGNDHMSFRTDKLMVDASVSLVSEPASVEFSEKEKKSFLDKVIVESDENTETEDEEIGERLVEKDSGESSKTDVPSSSNGNEGPDVDKKADEFIAKFREQIRLQRIDSLKKSARITTRKKFFK